MSDDDDEYLTSDDETLQTIERKKKNNNSDAPVVVKRWLITQGVIALASILFDSSEYTKQRDIQQKMDAQAEAESIIAKTREKMDKVNEQILSLRNRTTKAMREMKQYVDALKKELHRRGENSAEAFREGISNLHQDYEFSLLKSQIMELISKQQSLEETMNEYRNQWQVMEMLRARAEKAVRALRDTNEFVLATAKIAGIISMPRTTMRNMHKTLDSTQQEMDMAVHGDGDMDDVHRQIGGMVGETGPSTVSVEVKFQKMFELMLTSPMEEEEEEEEKVPTVISRKPKPIVVQKPMPLVALPPQPAAPSKKKQPIRVPIPVSTSEKRITTDLLMASLIDGGDS